MIYKTFQKVSNVCQVLDKSKYPKTQTINGVTFTNNGDGTITVNGTATSTAFFLLFKYLDSLIPKHKYLLSGSPNDASVNAYIQCYDDTNFEWLRDTGGGAIAIFPKQVVNLSGANNIRIRIASGYTANNLVFKPQLFDLTEMYGAGNEPTTVEQFRQDFPEEMYDYSPHCFVKSYKTLLKASDVCQLMDKSKFPATRTINGVTFTNNGDGTITVNGTATERAIFNIQTPNYFPSNLIGHKCLLETNTSLTIVPDTINIHATNWDVSNIKPIGEITATPKIRISVFPGYTANNLVFKPQLFDLTEMYGAGHEPTSVEQFRQDFPEEMYDYKPYSTIPSYKKSLVCKTKNLFDISKAKVNMKNDGSFIPTVGHTDHFYSMNVKAGETYTVSYYTTSFGSIGSGLNLSIQTGDFYRDGVMLFLKINPKEQYTYQKGTFTIPDGANKITFSSIQSSYYYNFMIELGNTATDYVPYGHL